MEGMWFTWNRQNTHSFGKLLAGNPTRPPAPVAELEIMEIATLKCVCRYSLRSPVILFPDLKHVGVLFSKLKFCVFCYSKTGIRIARIVPKECTLRPQVVLIVGVVGTLTKL